ncbi:YveK family protein [Paenibacillus abyssi]|uniref:Capsular polysaccharide biosynthesis protein YwqC n=1 Tax=Paenibacillus abyssi TaxID=1340531 RepID=A0A917CV23_9BACL|nr:Wzz/FepE/Etk N-terminal domain-containing protein [Paenibacillus abyssi]GGF98599.1 putative capsular polysaccharide biosynthesis protein YwqC [Paenibacillus abyssi]
MNIQLDLRYYVSLIRKRIWIVLLVIVLGAAASGLFSYMLLKPVYQAYTKLIVNSPNDQPGMLKLDLNAINTNISLINTYKEIIRTPAIMDVVVQKHPELGVTTEELMRKIRFSSVNGTQVITLAYQDTDYKKAARVVNSISEVFQQQISKIMRVDNVYLLHMADPAKLPAPVKPNPLLNIAISVVFSLLLGIGLVMLLDYFDDTIKNESDVQRYLGLPTLVMIPSIRQKDFKKRKASATIPSKAGEASSVTTS